MVISIAVPQPGSFAMQPRSHAGFETLRTMDNLRRYNAWLWAQVNPHIGQRVLEAGCGVGTFTRFLATRQRVISVDINRQYVEMVRATHAHASHVRVERADLSTNNWPDLVQENLDTVISMNVLEHLPDDEAVLRKFWHILQPGGRLVLLVPAHAQLFGTIDAAVGHFRRYDNARMSTLLGRSGFVVDRVRYLNPTGVLGWVLNGRILRRSRLPEHQAAWYDRLYPALSMFERLNLPFGLSVLALARKRLV